MISSLSNYHCLIVKMLLYREHTSSVEVNTILVGTIIITNNGSDRR